MIPLAKSAFFEYRFLSDTLLFARAQYLPDHFQFRANPVVVNPAKLTRDSVNGDPPMKLIYRYELMRAIYPRRFWVGNSQCICFHRSDRLADAAT